MTDTAGFKKAADDYVKPAPREFRHFFSGANYLLYHLAAGAAGKAGDKKLAAISRPVPDGHRPPPGGG